MTRPAAVSSCDKYPFPGWTDSIGAGGGVIYGLGKGTLVHDLNYPHVVNLNTPCDYVVSAIIVSTAYAACVPVTQDIPIFQVSNSGAFPEYSNFTFMKNAFEFLKY